MMGNERTQEQREANKQGTREVLKESKGQNGGGVKVVWKKKMSKN